MNELKWYLICNAAEFLATGLTSRSYDLLLAGIGQRSVLVTRGELVGLVYEGIFLVPRLAGINPMELDDHAAYIDADENLWLGIPEA